MIVSRTTLPGRRRAGLVTALVATLFWSGSVAPVAAQEPTGSISGAVRASDGVPVPGVAIELRAVEGEPSARIAGTDDLGRYRIDRLEPGRYTLRARRIGFRQEIRTVTIDAGRATIADFTLTEEAVAVAPLSVDAHRKRGRFDSDAGTTAQIIAGDQVKRIPGLAEADVLRAVESLPGVVSTSDFSAAFNVRGGSADQNLILIDGLPIFNPFHLGGLFSVFNGDMIGRAELLSGGFPAEYGGRVSSVLNVETDPGTHPFEAQAGISLLATRAAVGAALPASVVERLGLRSARARVSARRSYFDLLLKPVVDFPYHLTDFQGYAEAWTDGGGRFTLTAYTGEDVLDLSRLSSEDFPLRLTWDWGNRLIGAAWSRPLDDALLRVRGGYSRFRTAIRFPDFDDSRFGSSITQTLLRTDLQFPEFDRVTLQAGLEASRFAYENYAETGGTGFGGGRDHGWLAAAYLQGRWRPDPDWLLEVGLRGDGWSPATAARSLLVAPRVAVKRFLSGGDAAIKLAGGRYTQFIHSLRDEELPVGIDLWVTSGEQAPIVVSDQVQLGYERSIEPGWSLSIEGYFRRFDGVTATSPADDPNDPTDDLLSGAGTAYGADLLLRRDATDGVSGWVAVSWLRAAREFADLFAGTTPPPEIAYPPVFDRRFDVDLVLRYPLPGNLDAGLRWNVGTGLPYTRAVGSYTYLTYTPIRGGWATERADDADDPETAVLLGPRNGTRYPAYHRLDISLRRTFTRGSTRWTPYLDVLNVYNRKNVLFYFYEYDRTPAVRTGVSMFPILPTFGLEVAF